MYFTFWDIVKTEEIRWQSFWNLWYVTVGEHCLSLWNTEAQSGVALLGKGAEGGQIKLELPVIYNEYKQLRVVSCPFCVEYSLQTLRSFVKAREFKFVLFCSVLFFHSDS